MSPDFESIVQAGVLAPSADNRHSFKIQLTPHGIGILGDAEYLGAPFHRKVLNWISLGAVVENMVIRAERLGYRAEARWAPQTIDSSLIVDLQLSMSEARDIGLDDAIPTRHSNRKVLFSGPVLGGADLAALKKLIADIPGVDLVFFDSVAARDALLRLVWLSESERFRTRDLHRDLFSAVRFDVGWRATASQGLPPAALAVEPGMRWAFSQLRHWAVMKPLSKLGLHRALGFRAAYLPCRLAPHRGVLTTRLPLEEGSIAVGRAMQRIWLDAERRGLAFQPLAGAALLALPGYEAVPVATGTRLRDGWKVLTSDTPLMLFRMGHAKRPVVRAGRPPYEDLMRE